MSLTCGAMEGWLCGWSNCYSPPLWERSTSADEDQEFSNGQALLK